MLCSFRTLAGGLLLCTLMGCKNLYQDISHRTSTSYLLYEAERDIDGLKFDRAIRNLDEVLSRVPTHAQALYMNSIAHSGRAGLRVLRILESAQNIGAGSLFAMLGDSLNRIDDDDMDDFKVATDYLEKLGPMPEDRNSDQNFYALFLYLGRIGAVINRFAYDSTNTLLSANFSSCHTVEAKSGPKTGLPDDAIDVIMTNIPRVIDTLERLAQQGSNIAIDVSSLQALGTFYYDPIPCSADPNDLQCLAVRTIINNGSTGVGLGTGGSFGLEGTLCAAVTP